jgi:4'-phosphopantetheinyl transferase
MVDRKRSLLGLRLLEEAVNYNNISWNWNMFRRDSAARPCIGNEYTGPGYDFNISHSGDIVVCAIGHGRLGIDIEKVTQVDINDFHSVMPESALKTIMASSRVEDEFFRFWTRIESVIKADGCGFAVELDSIRFNAKTATLGIKHWNYHDLDIMPGYACCLAYS